jgi:hypothetical protein
VDKISYLWGREHQIPGSNPSSLVQFGGEGQVMSVVPALFHFRQLPSNTAPLENSYKHESRSEEHHIESKSSEGVALPEPIPPLGRAFLFAALTLGLSGLIGFAWGLLHSNVTMENIGFACLVSGLLIGLVTAFLVTLLSPIL